MINFMGFCANQSIFRCAPTDDHTRGESSAGSGSAKAGKRRQNRTKNHLQSEKNTSCIFSWTYWFTDLRPIEFFGGTQIINRKQIKSQKMKIAEFRQANQKF
jgi:hypothetical protein